ncbi:MAG: NADP-dependent oxidoreductase [Salinisphaera sp.]|nr:NADP-dependent oxidoreductase [Salinisphaera sp.]
MSENLQWILKQRPQGNVSDDDIVLERNPAPTASDGELVLRTEYISLDPANRAWMNETATYMEPVALDGPMAGLMMGEVVESGSDQFAVGDRVMGLGSWSRFCQVQAQAFSKVPEVPGLDAREVFAFLMIVGPTAYFGINDICAPKAGETVVVSGAAGAVGSIAGQLAKARGCCVVGIAGGSRKCRLIVDDYGFDAAIDYRGENVAKRLADLCPDGIDCFFDNVGGDILSAVLGQVNDFARIAQCGAISTYNDEKPQPGPYNYVNVVIRRVKIQGFIVMDFMDRYPEAYGALAQLRAQGGLKWKIHEEQGLENMLNVFRKLFSGENEGKLLLKVD